MPKPFVSELVAGSAVDAVFLLAERNMAHKKDGNPFLTVTLADRTGQVKGVVWDQVERIAAAVTEGDFVHVRAQVGEYRGGLQMVVKDMLRVPADQVDPADFLPTTSRDVGKMFDRLREMTGRMQNPHLKRLFEVFWADDEFVAAYTRAPAAKMMHHAYIGGLLEHTLSMAVLAGMVAGHYSGVDRDLLLAGVILHDVGKVRELEYARRIDYTDEGRLLSHIIIGLSMLDEKLGQVPDFPPVQAQLLKHMIVSHHGSRAFGSPEPPKTIEAVLLNHIDEMDSRVNSIREYVAKDPSDGSWTPYHRLLERHFYKGPGPDTGND
ncbi:3'-5' exoribonuclease YhaM family protein [Desulfosarcina ovata]|uniref:HD family phosphohydrolase n=1 Tax=Desulfosarcina ovata subsp. ovata TaxID=2752305 RepID=A0A5K8A9V2_9BACT|nr:HD domain-containing protein [Desulfosarcina ovata]BBO89355.1 HD family phosphohydrolase [Desulfosarcina ovata subsp. ovata]